MHVITLVIHVHVLLYLPFWLTTIMTGRWKGTLGSSLSMYCHVLCVCVCAHAWIGGKGGKGRGMDNKHAINEITRRKRNHDWGQRIVPGVLKYYIYQTHILNCSHAPNEIIG
jgi:hypothetical protein